MRDKQPSLASNVWGQGQEDDFSDRLLKNARRRLDPYPLRNKRIGNSHLTRQSGFKKCPGNNVYQ